MALCRFFQLVPRGRELPDPAGPLSVTVPSPAIERTNEEVGRKASQVSEPHVRSVVLTTRVRTACGLKLGNGLVIVGGSQYSTEVIEGSKFLCYYASTEFKTAKYLPNAGRYSKFSDRENIPLYGITCMCMQGLPHVPLPPTNGWGWS